MSTSPDRFVCRALQSLMFPPDGDVECPKAKAEEACKTTCAAVSHDLPCLCMGPICSLDFGSILVQTWRDYESCAQRIAKKGEGDCIGQYFAFWKCIDACVRLSIRTGCLSQLLCWGPAR